MSSRMELELYRAAALTFEELGFLFPSKELDEDQQNAETEATVSVAFRGPINGRLVLHLCGNLLPTVAANMLGEAEPPTEPLRRDAIGELANVICGNALHNISNSKEVFYIDAPHVIENAESGSGTSMEKPTARVRVGLERGRADVLLFVNG